MSEAFDVFYNKSLAAEKHFEFTFFVIDVIPLAVYTPRPTQNGLTTHFWVKTHKLRNTELKFSLESYIQILIHINPLPPIHYLYLSSYISSIVPVILRYLLQYFLSLCPCSASLTCVNGRLQT